MKHEDLCIARHGTIRSPVSKGWKSDTKYELVTGEPPPITPEAKKVMDAELKRQRGQK